MHNLYVQGILSLSSTVVTLIKPKMLLIIEIDHPESLQYSNDEVQGKSQIDENTSIL